MISSTNPQDVRAIFANLVPNDSVPAGEYIAGTAVDVLARPHNLRRIRVADYRLRLMSQSSKLGHQIGRPVEAVAQQ
jgi:hypothetical protein